MIREGINDAPPGTVVATNHEGIKRKPQQIQSEEQLIKKQMPFETTAGQTPEMKKFLHEHRIDG